MKKRKIIIGAIILIAAIFLVSKVFVKSNNADFTEEKVVRGTIVQEVSETGTVKKGEVINLSFQSGGQIEKIYVQAGSQVKAGNILAKLDSGQLSIQYAEAQASLAVAKAQLQVAQTTASNSQTSLLSEKQNLADAGATAQISLDNAYEDALNALDDAYVKIYNALDVVKNVQITYFNKGDQEGTTVSGNKLIIEDSLAKAKTALDAAKASSKTEDLDSALSVIKKSLQEASSALAIIRQTCEVSFYRETVLAADKTYLDTQRTSINTTLTSVTNAQQAISLTKINNETSLNAANNRVLTAQGSLKRSQEDISLYQAQEKQAESRINLLSRQINDASIFAPTDGQVTAVNKKLGEIAQASQPVVSFISAGPFQIEADIYEEDVVKVKIGDPVEIKVTAFSGQLFLGKVILVNPAEKLIEGVVYYEIKIDFQSAPQQTKPGMTADIVIKTAQKDNVLIIPESAVTEKSGKAFVQIKEDDKLVEKEVTVGLRGGQGQVEIISGLSEGELIATPK